MTPKEKAESLVKKFDSDMTQHGADPLNYKQAKSCALIFADEMLVACPRELPKHIIIPAISWDFWKAVKEELQLNQ